MRYSSFASQPASQSPPLTRPSHLFPTPRTVFPVCVCLSLAPSSPPHLKNRYKTINPAFKQCSNPSNPSNPIKHPSETPLQDHPSDHLLRNHPRNLPPAFSQNHLWGCSLGFVPLVQFGTYSGHQALSCQISLSPDCCGPWRGAHTCARALRTPHTESVLLTVPVSHALSL